MIPRSDNPIAAAFKEGQAKRRGNTVSTGRELYLFDNKIAEWRDDGLYVSNGGYVTFSRNGNEIPGSNTTKARLNDLPRVSIYQAQCKWYLNGEEWDGSWVKVEGPQAPEINDDGNYFLEATHYIRTDGWRGYEEPVYAVAGANNTGDYSDSPCPTDICMTELRVYAIC